MDNLGTFVLAIGALGTASFGIIEGLKWTPLGRLGFGQLRKILGKPVMQALQTAYGSEYEMLLQAQYRAGRIAGDLPRTLRQGARIGLTPENAAALGEQMNVVDPAALADVARTLQAGGELEGDARGVLGRYELALDARIDAALAVANQRYASLLKVWASVISIIIALVVGTHHGQPYFTSVVVGIAAVPVAPIAKDLAKGLQAAAKALPRKA